MKFINDLRDKNSVRTDVAGGKGSNLHKLIELGFNVPEGFVLNTKAFKCFIDYNNLFKFLKTELNSLRVDDFDSISYASEKIKKKILTSYIPPEVYEQIVEKIFSSKLDYFSVRSSGVFEDNFKNSWAGLFDSYLQVSKNDLENAIKKCWASLFNSRAISYNIKAYKNVQNLRFAVVIQQMIFSEKSGVAFSIEPQTSNKNKIIIEATSGYGEDVVSGKELPFNAVFDKKEKLLLDKSTSTNQYTDLLSINELMTIVNQVIKLEKKFKKPVDTEWSFVDQKLFFLQIRPITTLNKEFKFYKSNNHYPEFFNYELTFKTAGLNLLFTDILASSYKYLNPLFTFENNQFFQYIAKHNKEFATKFGIKWLSKQNGFLEYREKFEDYYDKNIQVLNDITFQRRLSKSSTDRFFQILVKLIWFYSKMDNYFTDLTYVYIEHNSLIKNNLHYLSLFKDKARAWINETSIDKHNILDSFLEKISKHFEVAKDDLEYYKIFEFKKLFDNVFVPNNEIQSRKISFVIYYIDKERKYLTGYRAKEIINRNEVKKIHRYNSPIKGQVANKKQNRVVGTARVINIDYGNLEKMKRQISEMQKGEILIAEFTAPELISACRKAKAIVTDLGGLLSHAAIISRELKIPCLVGTENASKLLKTGDKIVVDFVEGVINRK